MHQTLVLLDRTCRAKQRSLELCEEAVFLTRWIEATRVVFPVQKVNVFAREASLQQGVDCGASARCIGDGAHDPIRRISDEFRLFSRAACHGSSGTLLVRKLPRGGARMSLLSHGPAAPQLI
jgi:hypothetical protein